jgi:hypothetical protein
MWITGRECGFGDPDISVVRLRQADLRALIELLRGKGD